MYVGYLGNTSYITGGATYNSENVQLYLQAGNTVTLDRITGFNVTGSQLTITVNSTCTRGVLATPSSTITNNSTTTTTMNGDTVISPYFGSGISPTVAFHAYTGNSNTPGVRVQRSAGNYFTDFTHDSDGGGEFLNVKVANATTAASAAKIYASQAFFTGAVTALPFTAIPAGGTAGAGFMVSSTGYFGVFFGSGAPTLSAAKGSLYLRSDGSGVNDRMYVNTNGTTTWTAVVTVA